MPISLGAIIGGSLMLLTLGFFIVNICLPVHWRTRGVWLLVSFVGIPAGIALVTLAVAWPPLFVLGLIIAFAGGTIKKKR